MRRFVDGIDMELADDGAGVSALGDRLLVRTSEGTFSAIAVKHGDTVLVSYKGRQYVVQKKMPLVRGVGGAASGEMRAPMPGQIVDVLVAEGAMVNKGDRILILEAMKTQQPFTAPFNGVVTKLAAVKGGQVQEGDLLAKVEALLEGSDVSSPASPPT